MNNDLFKSKKIHISETKWRQLRKDVNKESEKFIKKHTDISCNNCNKNYCCINQSHIEVFDMEFDALEYYIEDKHIKRAEKEMNRKDGLISCPFNDPNTGMCDIYENRFSICSSQATVSPIDDCNSILNPNSIIYIVDKQDFINYFKDMPLAYMMTLANEGPDKNHDIIEQFKRRKSKDN